jgi:gamma-glutamyltranspeptidase/glutathione hydrolase
LISEKTFIVFALRRVPRICRTMSICCCFSRALMGTSILVTTLVVPLRAQRLAVEAEHGMVVSVHPLATQAGLEILKKGGNAVDAAVATAFALGVVYPWAGSLGGGGFMLVHLADGRDIAIDYRETAPAAATRDMYLGSDGNVIRGSGSSTVGWRASGVPGDVAGFALALEKYGSHKISWADVIEPARRLAAEGHAITQYNAARFHLCGDSLAAFEESKHIFLHDGAFWRAGDFWRQPELAATLVRLQQNGPREFYEGKTAQLIADAMGKNGGTISFEDLKKYRAIERVPLRGKYRGFEIVTMPPPSSSGITLLQLFGMLEPFNVEALGQNSAAKYHLFIEAMRRAFRIRAEYVGDPDFVKVPVAHLLDPAYIKSRLDDFSPEKATPSSMVQSGLGKVVAVPIRESTETTHFSIIDADGNAVANTFTLNGGFGSSVTIPGTGLLMNNEMDDFTAKPGVPNAYLLIQGEANAIQPGKRPLSAMSPTFVFKERKLFLITGSPGGPTIISAVFQLISNVIDFKMPVAQAVDAPRIHHQWMPDVVNYEPYGLSTDTEAILRAKGHQLAVRSLYGTQKQVPVIERYPNDTMTIMIDPVTNLRLGVADSRKPDSLADGY